MMRRIGRDEFIFRGRDAVLAAMDDFAQDMLSCSEAQGWQDDDLSLLIPVLDAHFATLADRLNDPNSRESGSANIVFD